MNDEFRLWFGSSKILGDDKQPLVVYHGTPDASFEQFEEFSFFSADPQYASKFTTSACASSSFYGVTDRAPAVFPCYLKIENPFDTRLPPHRKLYEDLYYMKFGNGAALTGLGLPDWVEARDLAEFLKDEIPEFGFDGLYIDEGKDAAGQRPMAYMPLSCTQIRSAISLGAAPGPNAPAASDNGDASRSSDPRGWQLDSDGPSL